MNLKTDSAAACPLPFPHTCFQCLTISKYHDNWTYHTSQTKLTILDSKSNLLTVSFPSEEFESKDEALLSPLLCVSLALISSSSLVGVRSPSCSPICTILVINCVTTGFFIFLVLEEVLLWVSGVALPILLASEKWPCKYRTKRTNEEI